MRDKILAEIRRLAAMNDGRAPGSEVFAKDSGIRKHEWLGKHWSKWGDALVEAGFEPNAFQQKANLETVYPKFAEAVRHFKRVPTEAELNLFWREEKNSPRYKSVVNRFKSKTEMFNALRLWAESNSVYSDIVPLLPSFELTRNPAPTERQNEGYVYLLQSGLYYKIGRGDDLERRVKQIRIALPDASTLVHAIRTDDPPGIEAFWNRRFSDRRANGEWFKLTRLDIAAFKKRKFQ
jgi:Meiotically up-regulated gene 113